MMTQDRLCEVLGISKPTLHKVHKRLAEGVHFSKKDGEVNFNASGVDVVCRFFGVDPETVKNADKVADSSAAEQTEAKDQEATVTDTYRVARWMNPRIVSALVDGKPVRVRTVAAWMFKPDMKIPVKKVSEGLFECCGKPRKPGVWR